MIRNSASFFKFNYLLTSFMYLHSKCCSLPGPPQRISSPITPQPLRGHPCILHPHSMVDQVSVGLGSSSSRCQARQSFWYICVGGLGPADVCFLIGDSVSWNSQESMFIGTFGLPVGYTNQPTKLLTQIWSCLKETQRKR